VRSGGVVLDEVATDPGFGFGHRGVGVKIKTSSYSIEW
jgi:hypothetical protein